MTPFPSTGVLDDFNRADGALGGPWAEDTPGMFTIAQNQLNAAMGTPGAILWPTSFGADQEAFITVLKHDPADFEFELLLKSQASQGECDALQVTYHGTMIQVYACGGNNAAPVGPDVVVAFAPGDVFGARAYASGAVEAYKNGVLVGTWDTSAWSYHTLPGKIGVECYGLVANEIFDDFGGGTVVP